MKLSFVIPCYRSEHTIQTVVNEVIEQVEKRPGTEYEIILVNDYSPDQVWSVIKSLATENHRIKGISFAKNFGQHSALLAGYAECTGDYVISLDDDGQTPVEALYCLIDKLDEGYDVVYAYYNEIKRGWIRKFGTWMSQKLGEMMLGQPKELKGSSFYAARKFVIDEMILYKNPFPYLGGLVLRTTQNVACIPTEHRRRMEGTSGYSFKKLLAVWLNGFTAFSVKPLEISIYSGFILLLLGVMYAVICIVRTICGYHMVFTASAVLSTLLVIGGMILIMLGMIGEYVGRIYICMNNSPQYVIKETTDDE